MIPFSYASKDSNMDVVKTAKEPAKTLKDVFDFLEESCRLTRKGTEKHNCHRFIPSVFEDNKRDLSHFKKTRLISIDVDSIVDEDVFFEDLEKLETKGVGFILNGTPSHGLDNPRYRMFLELKTDCLNYNEYASSYKETISSILPQAQFKKDIKKGYSVDMSVKHAASFFYIPQEDKLDTFVYNEGAPISLQGPLIKPLKTKEDEKLIDMDMSRIKSKEETEASLEDVLAYLEKQDLSITKDYHTWLQVCYACVSLKYNGFSKEESLTLFQRFSFLDKDHATPEEIDTQFEACYVGTNNKVNIASIFYAAKEEGWYKTHNTFQQEVIGMVEAKGGNKVHLVYNNVEGDTLLQMTQEVYTPPVAQAHICNAQDTTFELANKDATYENKDGDIKRMNIPDFLTINKVPQPGGIEFLLGASKKGTYYNTLTNSIVYAKHELSPTIPKFNPDIHEWLKQLPIETNWLYTYLFHFTDLNVGLPALHLHGESNAGKSLLIILLASVHSGFVTNLLEDKGFDAFAGTTPLKIYEEKSPQDASELKRQITMDRTHVDQKFDGRMLTIIGFFRVLIAVNEKYFNLPGDANADKGALLRRVQPIEYTQEHVEYLEKIGGIRTTRSWVAGAFKNHLAYLRLNPQEFDLIPPSEDILVLKPIGMQDAEKAIVGISTFHRGILESLDTYAHERGLYNKDKNKPIPKYVYLIISEFTDWLLEKRHTNRPLQLNVLRGMLENVFGKLGLTSNKKGERTFRLEYEKAKGLAKQLNLNVEEGEE